MLLVYFSNEITEQDAQVIRDIAGHQSNVHFIASDATVLSKVAPHIPSIKCIRDLFQLELESSTFITTVIHIGTLPYKFLLRIARSPSMLSVNTYYEIKKSSEQEYAAGNWLMSGATFKTLQLAIKLKIYNGHDELIEDPCIKMLFLAHKLGINFVDA